jgi:dolichol-phosphate mannosyltransferase
VPADWNGKAWGLQVGVDAARPATRWLLTVDADTRPRAPLVRALLAQAARRDLPALSVATLQEIAGEGLLHPALLTTLVYRFGIPGQVARHVRDVQANGQCFLFRRDALAACGGFAATRDSICEDITIARLLVRDGSPVGFYEAGDLVTVRMYEGWRETWRNWTRSLPMRDRYSGLLPLVGWLEVLLVQALPLPLWLGLVAAGVRGGPLFAVNGALAVARLGVLCGTARAYRSRPWTYWLSPLCDLPVALKLGASALRRQHVWRGRVLVRGAGRGTARGASQEPVRETVQGAAQ